MTRFKLCTATARQCRSSKLLEKGPGRKVIPGELGVCLAGKRGPGLASTLMAFLFDAFIGDMASEQTYFVKIFATTLLVTLFKFL
jgi:hypothetical protein